jgi:hypothetical protein
MPAMDGHQFLQGSNKRGSGDQRLHRFRIEQRGVIVAMARVPGSSSQQHLRGPTVPQRFHRGAPRFVWLDLQLGQQLPIRQPLDQFPVLLPRFGRRRTDLAKISRRYSSVSTGEPKGTAKTSLAPHDFCLPDQVENVAAIELGTVQSYQPESESSDSARPTRPSSRTERSLRRRRCEAAFEPTASAVVACWICKLAIRTRSPLTLDRRSQRRSRR